MISAREIEKTKIPRDRWIIDQLLEIEGAMFFSGASDLNKSILLMILMIKLRLGGQTFLGFKTRKVNTIIVLQNENSNYAMKDRFKKIRKTMDLDRLPAGIFFDEEPVDFNDDDSVDKFIKRTKQINRVRNKGFPELIIVDPISSYRSGDENLAHKWQEAERNINKIRKMGSAFILVHHPPGNNPEKLRGSLKMPNWADTVLIVKGKGSQPKREYKVKRHRKATRQLDKPIVRYFNWKKCMLSGKRSNVKCPPEKVRDILKKHYNGVCTEKGDLEEKLTKACNCGRSTAKKGIDEAIENNFIRSYKIGKNVHLKAL